MVEQIFWNIILFPINYTFVVKGIINNIIGFLGFLALILIWMGFFSSKYCQRMILLGLKIIFYSLVGFIYILYTIGLKPLYFAIKVPKKQMKNHKDYALVRQKIVTLNAYLDYTKCIKLDLSNTKINFYNITQEEINAIKIPQFLKIISERISSLRESRLGMSTELIVREIFDKIKYVIGGLFIIGFSALFVQLLFYMFDGMPPPIEMCNIQPEGVQHLQVFGFKALELSTPQVVAIRYLIGYTGLYSLILFLISGFFYMVSYGKKLSLIISKIFMIMGISIVILAFIMQYIGKIYCK